MSKLLDSCAWLGYRVRVRGVVGFDADRSITVTGIESGDHKRERNERFDSSLNQSGVYLLFGVSDETGNPIVYIGQAGIRKNGHGILNRWEEHKRDTDKDWWVEAVAFTTANNSFGPTEISYLENQFRNMALEAGRYEVTNGN